MKLITLNLWGGIVYEPLMEFIKTHAKDTDIFCFQEMLFGDIPDFTPGDRARGNLFSEIKTILVDFNSHKRISPSKHFQHESIFFGAGQAIFVRKGITVTADGGFLCYDEVPMNTVEGGKVTGNVEWVDIEYSNQILTIANLHGLWQKGTKKVDTPERILQSTIIKDFLSKKKGKKILCGDFNLKPDGKSIALLEEGMRNLITEYGAISTRSGFYTGEEKFADYVLVSPNVGVLDFKVLQDQVSDHLPL